MVEPCRFEPERVGNVYQGNNGYDNENDGAERLLNLNWCLCGRCEVQETAKEYVCCVQEPESENKLEGTLSTSLRIRRVLVLFPIFFIVCFLLSSLNIKSFWAKM